MRYSAFIDAAVIPVPRTASTSPPRPGHAGWRRPAGPHEETFPEAWYEHCITRAYTKRHEIKPDIEKPGPRSSAPGPWLCPSLECDPPGTAGGCVLPQA